MSLLVVWATVSGGCSSRSGEKSDRPAASQSSAEARDAGSDARQQDAARPGFALSPTPASHLVIEFMASECAPSAHAVYELATGAIVGTRELERVPYTDPDAMPFLTSVGASDHSDSWLVVGKRSGKYSIERYSLDGMSARLPVPELPMALYSAGDQVVVALRDGFYTGSLRTPDVPLTRAYARSLPDTGSASSQFVRSGTTVLALEAQTGEPDRLWAHRFEVTSTGLVHRAQWTLPTIGNHIYRPYPLFAAAMTDADSGSVYIAGRVSLKDLQAYGLLRVPVVDDAVDAPAAPMELLGEDRRVFFEQKGWNWRKRRAVDVVLRHGKHFTTWRALVWHRASRSLVLAADERGAFILPEAVDGATKLRAHVAVQRPLHELIVVADRIFGVTVDDRGSALVELGKADDGTWTVLAERELPAGFRNVDCPWDLRILGPSSRPGPAVFE